MNYRVDFSISNGFHIVEQAVFRLACNGVVDVDLIKALLNIFSEQVIAIAIRNLVNAQILQADLEKRYLVIPDTLKDLMDACGKRTIKLSIPPEIAEDATGGSLFLPCNLAEESKEVKEARIDVKRAILSELLPGINVADYSKVLDLYLMEADP